MCRLMMIIIIIIIIVIIIIMMMIMMTIIIIILMMMMMIMMVIIIIIIIATLKGAIRDFYNRLTAPRTVSNMYAQVASMLNCINRSVPGIFSCFGR